MRVGIDLVEVSRIDESIDRFGDRFLQRLFTHDEIAYARACAPECSRRLAARFAAKEAVIKALSLSEAGVGWRDIEVRRLPEGACQLELHGKAAARAAELGVCDMALSLSHDGDYAGAVVAIACKPSRATLGFPRTGATT
jgi:holo-[acyl-carrier protein] synthase